MYFQLLQYLQKFIFYDLTFLNLCYGRNKKDKKMKAFARVLLIILAGCSIIILPKSPIFATGSILWCLFWFKILDDSKSKIKQFTLVELIAVIAIMSILLASAISIFGNIDKDKRDIQVLHSQLMKQQLKSLKYATEIYKVEYEGLYKNPTLSDGDLYFKAGVPVKDDGSNYIGCQLFIGEYFIKINTFTGKFSFY